MAPKKATGGKAAKAQKIVEDKTFGLKNKKGAKQQKFVQQVQQSVNATVNKGGKGPSKKELKEMQKKQEEEMLALFNVVPKKQNEQAQQKEEELDPDAGPSFTDITQEIEYKRANVVAKTKITEEVFRQWRNRKMEERRKAAEDSRKERMRKGLLTGREIFMDAGHTYEDDENCVDDSEMMREINDEEEIKRMEQEAEAARRAAWEQAGYMPEADAASASGTTLKLSAEEQAELFDDDDDDDDLDLDALENQVKNASVAA